ncbi:MAG: TIGR04255 family protein, partial [Rhodomicrobium sp.]
MTLPHPFSGPPSAEVPLPDAPLVRVLAQVSFPQIFNIAKADTVAPFQERIRGEYPLTQPEVLHTVQSLGPDS